MTVNLDGAKHADQAIEQFRSQLAEKLAGLQDEHNPLLEIKLTGRVRFHPFELGRERLRLVLDELCAPLHVEIKNHLSLVTAASGSETEKKSLAEIEKDVLHELITSRSEYKGREDELVRLALTIRDQVLKGDIEGEELLGLLQEP
jgi:hypothetical protein